MNGFVIASLALVAAANFAEATFVFGTAAVATTGTTVALTGGSAAALGLLGGVVLLKGLILGAAILSSQSGRSSRRGRRSAEDETDAAFAVLLASEPAQCYRRLICDLATGTQPRSENDVILSLFNDDVSIQSSKFEFATAAKVGKMVKNTQLCEVRYSCPLSSNDIQKLFA
jgi:hypothetical protein